MAFPPLSFARARAEREWRGVSAMGGALGDLPREAARPRRLMRI